MFPCQAKRNVYREPVVAERTYTFKAPAALADRLRNASRALDDADDDLALHVAAELLRALANADAQNQSALIRGVLETLVATVEAVAEERAYAAGYAAMADDGDAERDAFMQAALAAAAVRWRDEA
jgi:hypothetical protein